MFGFLSFARGFPVIVRRCPVMMSTRCNGFQAAVPDAKPLVELHAHLDGSMRPDTIHDIARIRGMKIGSEDISVIRKHCLYHEEDEHSLIRFLKSFFYFIPVVRGDKAALERIAYEFCEDQALQGVAYTEARYSPHLLAAVPWEGLVQHEFCSDAQRQAYEKTQCSADDVVVAVSRGLERGCKDFGVIMKSILCCITNRPDLSMEVTEVAHRHRNKGVVAVDLAGYEDAVPMEEHQKAFERAKELGIHRTVHAGETGNPHNVRKAIETLHAERIGHGYAIVKDEGVYGLVAEQRTHLEACIYSSHCTGALKTIEGDRHPIVRWNADRLNFSLSTDDCGVLQTTLRRDYELAKKEGLTDEDLVRLVFNGARSCFLPEEEKAKLIAQLNKVHHTNF